MFGELVRDFPDAPRASEAAYLRVRALDVARAKDPARGGAFEEALVTYVTRYPKADGAAEAHWLARRPLPDARRLREGRGGAGQGAAGSLRHPGPARRPRMPDGGAVAQDDRRGACRARQGPARLRGGDAGQGADEPLVARAALMGALVAVGTTPPDRETTSRC